MRRNILFIVTSVCVVLSGLAAWHFSGPARERYAFVRRCVANSYPHQECSCTYDAYKEVRSPYAEFLKSSVHDSRSDFAKHASILFGRKLAHAGTGIDPAEFTNAIRQLGEDASVRKVLGVVGDFLSRHKFKIAGHLVGTGALVATYRIGRVGFEVIQVKHTLDRHCGGLTATIQNAPQRTWDWMLESARKAGRAVGIND